MNGVGLPELDDQSPLTKMRMKKKLSNGTEAHSMNTSIKVGDAETQKTTNYNTATHSIITQQENH
jgi:hypothetical protein